MAFRKHIKRLQKKSKKKEVEETDRRLSLFSELKEVKGYSRDKLIMVGQYISKDSYKVDYFFALPKEYKRDYIRLKLNECNPYRPSFDHFPPGDL